MMRPPHGSKPGQAQMNRYKRVMSICSSEQRWSSGRFMRHFRRCAVCSLIAIDMGVDECHLGLELDHLDLKVDVVKVC